MRDLPGFDNVAYFDSAKERDWFIDNVEGIPDVQLTKLPIVIRDDVEMFPLLIVFEETETPSEVRPPLTNVPF